MKIDYIVGMCLINRQTKQLYKITEIIHWDDGYTRYVVENFNDEATHNKDYWSNNRYYDINRLGKVFLPPRIAAQVLYKNNV